MWWRDHACWDHAYLLNPLVCCVDHAFYTSTYICTGDAEGERLGSQHRLLSGLPGHEAPADSGQSRWARDWLLVFTLDVCAYLVLSSDHTV